MYEKDLVGKYHKTTFSFTPVLAHRVAFFSGVRARPDTSCNNISSPKGCYSTEQMTFVMGIFNFNVKELAPKHGLSFTTQYRFEYRDFSNQSEKPKTGIGYTIFGLNADDKVFRLRNQLKLAYTYSYLEGYGITPYIQGEYFINLSNNSWKQPRNQINVDQTRVQVGIDFTIAKKYTIGVFYTWRLQYQQSELASGWNNQRQWGWQTENIFATSTKFVF